MSRMVSMFAPMTNEKRVMNANTPRAYMLPWRPTLPTRFSLTAQHNFMFQKHRPRSGAFRTQTM